MENNWDLQPHRDYRLDYLTFWNYEKDHKQQYFTSYNIIDNTANISSSKKSPQRVLH